MRMSESCVCHVGPHKYRLPYPPPVYIKVPVLPITFEVVDEVTCVSVPLEMETWIQSFEVVSEPMREHIVYYKQWD